MAVVIAPAPRPLKADASIRSETVVIPGEASGAVAGIVVLTFSISDYVDYENYVGYLDTFAVVAQAIQSGVVEVYLFQLRAVDLPHPEVVHHDHSLSATAQPPVDADHEVLLSRLPEVLRQFSLVHCKCVLVPALKVNRQPNSLMSQLTMSLPPHH